MNLFKAGASSPSSRFLLGFGLLFSAIMTQSMLWCVAVLIVSMFLLRALDGHWLTSMRLLRLMRWFLIPILVLHALLSPGQLLLPEWFVPITREGLMQGIRLSLHLSAVFFVAMLMFRLLRRAEWLSVVFLLPGMGKRLMVYVCMMGSMKMNMTRLLVDLRLQFRLRRDVKRSALLLMSAFQQALADASDHAAMLWLRWPNYLPLSNVNQHRSAHYSEMSVLLALLGCAAFLQAWL
ncbi:hypothetical protein JYT48_03010 [Mariprofundus ferrooxydans]|nr:hypothetical protein [Mariprofundus ferrooxydans]